MCKPPETDEISIAPEEWAEMLCEAGAREPWAHSDAPQRLTAGITFRFPKPSDRRKRGVRDRASEAIAELRRTLPKIIEDGQRLLAALDDPPADFQKAVLIAARSGVERELDELQRLFVALPRPGWQLDRPRTPPWQLDAARLYTLYRRHVDPSAGTSADGPTIRFIQLALLRMGSRGGSNRADAAHAERESIGKALRRMHARSRRIKLDK
jgi:hypothetical protein